MMLRFSQWMKDQPELDNPGLIDALNCFASTELSYGPWFDLQEVGNALDARPQGGGWFRGVGGTIFGTAFDAAKAYGWNGATWADISRLIGGAYAVAAEDGVSTTQFGDLVVAVNFTDAPQKFEIGVSTNYEALGGSPPIARFCATLRDFVLLGRIVGAQNRIAWSAINNAEAWTPGLNQSDEQNIPDGGRVMGIVGGEYGLVFMERSIHRLTYRGPPVVFQRDKVSERIGCCAENSIATYEQTSFFLDFSGFYAIDGGQAIRRIGGQKIDDFFWGDVNKAFLHRVVGTVEPGSIKTGNTFYIVTYPSNNSSDGTPDRLLIYNATLDRWTRAEQAIEYILPPFLSNQGYNTDTIDAVIGDTDATTFLVDSSQFLGDGQAKLAAFSPNFKLATFEGPALEPLWETQEIQPAPGQRTHGREVWVFADGGTPSVSIGHRNEPTDAVTFTSYSAKNAAGFCPIDLDARFVRARVKLAAGGTWQHAQGLDYVARKSGRYN